METLEESRARARECFAVAYLKWTDDEWSWEQAAEYWKSLVAGRDGKHCGDCTSEPHSCVRCHYEEIAEIAGKAAELLSR